MWPFRKKEQENHCPQCGEPIDIPIYCEECKQAQRKPGGMIMVDDLDEGRPNKKLPCPMDVIFAQACLCIQCEKQPNCAMEKHWRNLGCFEGRVVACNLYQCEGDDNAEKKRICFGPGRAFLFDIFRFTGRKPQKDSQSQ